MSARSAFDFRSLIDHRLGELQENWSFLFWFVCKKKYHYYFNYCIAAGMDRQAMIRKWTCIIYRVMKRGSCLDWMCRPCDDLICLGCFHSRKPFLQSCYRCPSCGNQLPPSFTAFTLLVTHQQAAHDDAKRKMILTRLNKFNNIKALWHVFVLISILLSFLLLLY